MAAARPSRALAVVALLALAGCSAAPGTTASPTTDAVRATTGTTTAETTATTTTTSETVPFGTQFVSVEPGPPSEGEGVAFENLSEPRREVFLRALQRGQLRFAPSEEPPFSFHNESRPRYVRYNGVWYHVRVAIV